MKTIQFADDGQDFLEWDLDDAGKVVDCRPFQAWLWVGKKVLNHADIKDGDYAFIGRDKAIIHVVTGVTTEPPAPRLNLEPCN